MTDAVAHHCKNQNTPQSPYALPVLLRSYLNKRLRIKAFYGTSENAVKTQIWIAISVYVLIAIIKKQLKLKLSLYSIL